MSKQIVVFELHVTSVDSADHRRWNGSPMPSSSARIAFHVAVDAFRGALRERGFEIAHTEFGVSAYEIEETPNA